MLDPMLSGFILALLYFQSIFLYIIYTFNESQPHSVFGWCEQPGEHGRRCLIKREEIMLIGSKEFAAVFIPPLISGNTTTPTHLSLNPFKARRAVKKLSNF